MRPSQCYKLIKTGGICEIYISDLPFSQTIGNRDVEPKDLPWEFKVILDAMRPDRSQEYQARSAFRARNTIRRLVQTNFSKDSKFLTLTFNNQQGFDINDVSITHHYFKLFIRRLVNMYGEFRYLAVPEFQKRGAVHYHMVTDLPFIKSDLLAEVWGHGFVKINQIKQSSRVGVYISKYLTKEAYAPENGSFRKFFYSKNLSKPEVVYGERVVNLLAKLRQKYAPKFTGKYESMYNGDIRYFEFVLYREEVISNESIVTGDS